MIEFLCNLSLSGWCLLIIYCHSKGSVSNFNGRFDISMIIIIDLVMEADNVAPMNNRHSYHHGCSLWAYCAGAGMNNKRAWPPSTGWVYLVHLVVQGFCWDGYSFWWTLTWDKRSTPFGPIDLVPSIFLMIFLFHYPQCRLLQAKSFTTAQASLCAFLPVTIFLPNWWTFSLLKTCPLGRNIHHHYISWISMFGIVLQKLS